MNKILSIVSSASGVYLASDGVLAHNFHDVALGTLSIAYAVTLFQISDLRKTVDKLESLAMGVTAKTHKAGR